MMRQDKDKVDERRTGRRGYSAIPSNKITGTRVISEEPMRRKKIAE